MYRQILLKLPNMKLKKNPYDIICYDMIQINHQPDATVFQFIILTFVYSSTCFGHFPAHHQELNDCSGSLWFYPRIVVAFMLCWWLGRWTPLYEGKTRACHCNH
jgi:hypothetical protein